MHIYYTCDIDSDPIFGFFPLTISLPTISSSPDQVIHKPNPNPHLVTLTRTGDSQLLVLGGAHEYFLQHTVPVPERPRYDRKPPRARERVQDLQHFDSTGQQHFGGYIVRHDCAPQRRAEQQ